MTDYSSMMSDAPADQNSSTMMNGNSTMMAYNSTMMAGPTTEKSLYTPYYNMTYEETPLIAMAIFAEAIDSNYTQQANESLNDYSDSNLGSFPDDALGGNAGKKKSWIPITGIMGNVTFTYNGSAVKIEGSVKGVPDGTYIHVGNRRGHGLQHGYDYFQNRTRHVGDTGNIISTNVDGWTGINVEDKMANMHYGHTNSILYR